MPASRRLGGDAATNISACPEQCDFHGASPFADKETACLLCAFRSTVGHNIGECRIDRETPNIEFRTGSSAIQMAAACVRPLRLPNYRHAATRCALKDLDSVRNGSAMSAQAALRNHSRLKAGLPCLKPGKSGAFIRRPSLRFLSSQAYHQYCADNFRAHLRRLTIAKRDRIDHERGRESAQQRRFCVNNRRQVFAAFLEGCPSSQARLDDQKTGASAPH